MFKCFISSKTHTNIVAGEGGEDINAFSSPFFLHINNRLPQKQFLQHALNDHIAYILVEYMVDFIIMIIGNYLRYSQIEKLGDLFTDLCTERRL